MIDKIWQDIKNDNSEIYGMKMLDVFLMLTKTIDSKHFNELTASQKKKIGPEAAVDLLVLALILDSSGPASWVDGGSRFKKRAEEMGMEVLSKLDADHITYILEEMIANTKSLEHAFVFGDNLRKLKNSTNAVRVLLNSIQYKHNNDGKTDLLEQFLSILRKYNLVDEEIKEKISYSFASRETSEEERDVVRKFLDEFA